MKSSHECAVWHSLYPWSSSWHCSMMSSQITVWAMWIVALRVAHAAASSVLTSGGFIGSDSFSHALLLRSPTHSGFVSLPLLPLTFLYSGQLQKSSIMEAGCVVAAVIENAASGPEGEPGSSDVLERWVALFFFSHHVSWCESCKNIKMCGDRRVRA